MIDRREQRRLKTRQALLDAAESVFAHKGYQDSSVLDITEAADLSKRTFYLHFTGKDELIEALALRGLQQLRQRIERQAGPQTLKDDPDPVTLADDLEWIVQQIFEYATNNPDLMQTIFGAGGSFRLQNLVRQYMAVSFEENFAQKSEWYAHAPVPMEIIAHVIAGMLFQMLSWWVCTPNDHTPADMGRMCRLILFEGIGINFECKDPEEWEESPES